MVINERDILGTQLIKRDEELLKGGLGSLFWSFEFVFLVLYEKIKI